MSIDPAHVAGTPGTPAPRRVRLWLFALMGALAVNALALLSAGFTPWWHAVGAAVGNVLQLASVAGIAWWMASRPAMRWPGASRSRLLAWHALAGAMAVGVAIAIGALGRSLPHAHGSMHPTGPGPSLGWYAWWFLFLYGAIAAATHAAHAAALLRARELEAARAELRALRAQLDPHFLFNALHSVGALVRSDPRGAEDAVERLGELLRYVLRAGRDPHAADADGARDAGHDADVDLGSELAFVHDYLALERIRFGDRLRVAEEVEGATRHALVPALVLQPLVENAVKYAVGSRRRGATVRLVARREYDVVTGDALLLGVVDDGPGAASPGAAGEGLGLDGLRRRLAARHPDRHRLEVATPAGGGFAVWLTLPWRTGIPSAAADRAAAWSDS